MSHGPYVGTHPISAPKPTRIAKKPRKRVNARKDLEKRLEAVIRELVFWRDGSTCVEKTLDGGRCGGGTQWGHILPRSQSSWLKFTIENTACQCANHNLLHKNGDLTMAAWYVSMFGGDGLTRLLALQTAHKNERPSVAELEARLTVYNMLLEHRPAIYTTRDLIRLGYYG